MSHQLSVHHYLKLADALERSGQRENAVIQLDQALQVYNGSIPLLYEKALLLKSLKRNAEAREAFELVLWHDPEHADAMIDFGVLKFQEGDSEGSTKLFEQAIALDPHNWKTFWHVAQAGREIESLEMVDSACSVVLALYPEFVNAQELPKQVRGYYAALGQDALIEKFFEMRQPKARTFVDVGAFDGIQNSYTRRLQEKLGWAGVCIESDERAFRLLQEEYFDTPVRCVNASVPERLLADILKAEQVQDIDLLVVEECALPLQAVESLNFDRYKPSLVVVNRNGQDPEMLDALMEGKGYKRFHDNGVDSFFEDAADAKAFA